MATRQQAIKAVKKFNGDIDWHNSEITRMDKYIIVDAPDGWLWRATQAATITMNWYCGEASDFWDELIELVSDGLEEYEGLEV